MATVINTDKKETSITGLLNRKENKKKAPLFRKMNYILMALGVVFLLIGYVLLSGGGSSSDEIFSDAIFDSRRLVVAPTIILIGLVIEIFAIMYYPKKEKNKEISEI